MIDNVGKVDLKLTERLYSLTNVEFNDEGKTLLERSLKYAMLQNFTKTIC